MLTLSRSHRFSRELLSSSIPYGALYVRGARWRGHFADGAGDANYSISTGHGVNT